MTIFAYLAVTSPANISECSYSMRHVPRAVVSMRHKTHYPHNYLMSGVWLIAPFIGEDAEAQKVTCLDYTVDNWRHPD